MSRHWSETLCAWWLRLHGWRIVEQGLTARRGSGIGEVDLIARRGAVLAFIEVKFRPDHTRAAAAISHRQQRRIVRAARSFLAAHPQFTRFTLRFDAILVSPWHLPHHVINAWDETP